MFGKATQKPTSILYCSQSLGLVAQCDHQPSMQRWTESNGKLQSAWRRHPPLVDCLVDGKPATKQAAAYPFRMNLLLAKAITASERANSLLPHPLSHPFWANSWPHSEAYHTAYKTISTVPQGHTQCRDISVPGRNAQPAPLLRRPSPRSPRKQAYLQCTDVSWGPTTGSSKHFHRPCPARPSRF